MTTSRVRVTILSFAALCLAGVVAAQIAKTPSVDGAKAYIISPEDGDTVSSPVTVQFGLKGMGIAPAGVNTPNTGHHHLLIDIDPLPDLNAPLVSGNDRIRHFGGGQTEVDLTLSPGRHTLQLVLADYLHTPHDKPITSEKITITVR